MAVFFKSAKQRLHISQKLGIQLCAGMAIVSTLMACNRSSATSDNPSGKLDSEVIPVATRFDPSYLQHAVLDTPEALPQAADNEKTKKSGTDKKGAEADPS